MRRDYVHKWISQKFGKLGHHVGKNFKTYIVSSVFCTILFGTGLQKLDSSVSSEDLLTCNGKSIEDHNYLTKMFPINFSSNFIPNKAVDVGSFAFLIIIAKDEKTVLRKPVFDEIVLVSKMIEEITIDWDDRKLKYSDLCSKNEGKCFENQIMSVLKDVFENGTFTLEYPLKINNNTSLMIYDTLALGGVSIDDDNKIMSANALKLFYFLDNSSKNKKARAYLWQTSFLESITKEFNYITFKKYTSSSLDRELSETIKKSLPYGPFLCGLMITFAVIACSSLDCVKSKPWIGVLTCLSSFFSFVTSFGILLYCGLQNVPMNTICPFIIVGIGMDDTFVMLEAYRRTDPKASIEERISSTFSEAGVSIFITSVTNFISFLLGGVTASFIQLQVFCIYMALCILFQFIYQLTFVGGFIALFGIAESKNLNAITFRPVTVKEGKHCCLPCLIGGKANTNNNENIRVRKFQFWGSLAKNLTQPKVKVFIIIAYFVYFGAAIWSSTNVKQSMELKDMAFYDSDVSAYFNADDKYYNQYRYRIQVVINATINYADPLVQKDIERTLRIFESDNLFAGSTLNESWLKGYLMYTSNKKLNFILKNFNFTDKDDFLYVLRQHFLNLPFGQRFKTDIAFNENFTDIIASRFFFQTNVTKSFTEFHKQFKSFVHKAKSESPFPLIIYHNLGVFMEMIDHVTSWALVAIAINLSAIVLVCLFILGSLICSICVTFSIVSIYVGIFGCMDPWNIHMDLHAFVILIIISGMSVDYAAHISYAYISSRKQTANGCLKHAIKKLGKPIINGCITTILGVAVFMFPPSNCHAVFFKIMFLSCILAAFHGIIFIPVLLTILTPICKKEVMTEAVRVTVRRISMQREDSSLSKYKRHVTSNSGVNVSTIQMQHM